MFFYLLQKLACTDPGWVRVKWDNGERYNYRMYEGDKYDLKPVPCEPGKPKAPSCSQVIIFN